MSDAERGQFLADAMTQLRAEAKQRAGLTKHETIWLKLSRMPARERAAQMERATPKQREWYQQMMAPL